jgi:hypothetical protein
LQPSNILLRRAKFFLNASNAWERTGRSDYQLGMITGKRGHSIAEVSYRSGHLSGFGNSVLWLKHRRGLHLEQIPPTSGIVQANS